jgi:hypothetical protein
MERRRRLTTTVTMTLAALAVVGTTGSRLSPAVAAAAAVSSLSSGRGVQTCVPITFEQCRNIGYNMTSMPNFVNDETQQEAEGQFSTYRPLLQYGCSPQLHLFLCSVYFPMCTDKVGWSPEVSFEPVLYLFGALSAANRIKSCFGLVLTEFLIRHLKLFKVRWYIKYIKSIVHCLSWRSVIITNSVTNRKPKFPCYQGFLAFTFSLNV